MTDVDGPRTGKIVSGDIGDASACATAGPGVVNRTTVVGTPNAVNAWFVHYTA